MVNFRANLVEKIDVKKLSSDNKYKESKVSFVQIDLTNKNDLKVLEETATRWKNCTFADNISFNASWCLLNKEIANNYFFYALTTQTENFKNLDVNNILGLAEVKKKSEKQVHIDYIQVDPQVIYLYRQPYKRCGTAILTCIKNNFETKLISLTGIVKDFFEHNGFKKYPDSKIRYFWHKGLK